MTELRPALAAAIFLATYAAVSVGHIRGLRIDRTGAAFIGGALMIACGLLTLNEAYQAIDWNTLALLTGMMIVVASLRLAGVFKAVNGWAIRHVHNSFAVLAAVTLASGIFSAFFVNDTVCLLLAPLVLELVVEMRLKPIPFFLALAMGSNVGSVATLTGNPQNILIGSFSGIAYARFAGQLAPVAAAGLLLTIVLLALFYRRDLAASPTAGIERPDHVHRWLMFKSLGISAAMLVFFFLGQPPAKVALAAGALLLVTRRIKPEKIYREIDTSLLLLFAGLFVVTRAAEKVLLTPDILARAEHFNLANVWVMSGVAGLLSNIVSNVPAVLILKPFVTVLGAHAEKA